MNIYKLLQDLFLGYNPSFKYKMPPVKPAYDRQIKCPVMNGTVECKNIQINSYNIAEISNCFIAFDVETTGLNKNNDRIIELGAALFINGKISKTFSSLVNPGVFLYQSASSINNITNDMIRRAPLEFEVYPKLIDFLGEAMNGKIIMCAHNASFDFGFLRNTLSRLGYNANIKYIDTLSIAKKYINGLDSYKQVSLEKYFGLNNYNSHRAKSDAENCGYILVNLLNIIKSESL